MAGKHKVKISLLGVMKEYEIEVDDKKKFMKEIEALIKDGAMYWFTDDKGEVGINTTQINSIEFLDDDGKREAGLVSNS
jgi:hypothetical protein